MKAAKHQGFDRSQLFLVRLWADIDSAGPEVEWHGRMQHVLTGEAHSFADWQTLIMLFLSRLSIDDAGTDKQLAIDPQA